MSFAEKIGALMQRPNDDLVAKDDVPWWLKYSARGLGTVAGGVGVFSGIFGLGLDTVTFNGFSIIFGDITTALLAFTCIVFEAPCCCVFVDFAQESSNFVEKRPNWNRAAYYLVASAAIFIFFKTGYLVMFGLILIFCTGLLYGMMALGKRASPDEMRNNAASIYNSNNQQFPPAATSNSNLVEGAQPAGRSNPFDSRV